MIWFTCKQCGKTHGRPESSVGTLVFCECGQGNPVPWESTVPEPQAPPPTVAAAPSPRLEPVSFDRAAPARASGPRPRRRRKAPPDPNFCLNHETLPSQKTCADCEEAFCNDCLVVFQGAVLCGPCKNLRVRTLNKPARLSTPALVSVLLAVMTGPLAFCLLGLGSQIAGILCVIPHGIALALGIVALRDTERDPGIRGRSLAITGILTAALAAVMTAVLTFLAPGLV